MNVSLETEIHPSVCPLDCPDTCSLSVKVAGDRIVDVKGSSANPYTAGVVCNKVVRSFPDYVHGKNRLTHPLKRTGPRGSGRYERITWDEALNLVHEGFARAIDAQGPEAVMPFNYAGPTSELASGSMDRRFFYYMGATLLNRGPLCGAVRGTAYASLYGAAPGMPPEQAAHSDLVVIWGNNVTVSNLHLMRVLKVVRAQGGKVVVIDPKRIKVAEQCDLHIQIAPGTDVVLGLALAAELERRDVLDHAFIDQWVLGADSYLQTARQYSLVDAARICGVPIDVITQLADYYVAASNVAVSIGNGIERGRSGGSGLRAAMAVQALTGNHGRKGAGVIAKSGLAAPKTTARLHGEHLMHEGTRVFNIVDVAEKLLDDTLETPVLATMIYNHNPVATHPDQGRLIEALMREDLFIVGCDIEMTDSMAFCDVILPATSHFETGDLFGAYGQNYVQRTEPVIAPVGDAQPNTEIFRRLAARFGFDDPTFKATDAELMDDAMDGSHPAFDGRAPSEIDPKSSIAMGSRDGAEMILCDTITPDTPSGRIELFSQSLEDRWGCGLPRYEPVARDHPLTLITPSSDKRTNAIFGGCSESQGPEVLEMNPADATARGLTDGDDVTVWNDRGEVTFLLKVTDATRPGVLYSPKGTWRASSRTGLTANALIPTDIRADIEEGACYNETFVDVRRT